MWPFRRKAKPHVIRIIIPHPLSGVFGMFLIIILQIPIEGTWHFGFIWSSIIAVLISAVVIWVTSYLKFYFSDQNDKWEKERWKRAHPNIPWDSTEEE